MNLRDVYIYIETTPMQQEHQSPGYISDSASFIIYKQLHIKKMI